jgi:MobA/MobL family
MAIYHLSVKPISRAGGRSATAAIAYRTGERVHDLSTGETFDYTRKRGVEHAEIVLPTAAAERDINWARDRQALWNAAESAEKRKDARVAREYELALPHEMTRGQRMELVRGFAGELANRYGVAVDFAIHRPHRSGDERNFHAHVLTTTREVEPTGLGAKASIEWSDTDRAKKGLGPAKGEVKAIRARWEEFTNERLKELGIEVRIDHRSLADQGQDREPGRHLGPAVAGMERRGIETEVGKRIRWEIQAAASERLARAAELGRVEREAADLQKSILDLSGDIKAAERERDAGEALAADKTPTSKRGMFEGLNLKTGSRVRERAPETASEVSKNLNRVLDRYARAWVDGVRMQEKGLPILEHQRSAFREASLALDGVRPGASADLRQALEYEPAAGQAMTQLQGKERTAQLCAALDHEARMRSDPNRHAERLVKTWRVLEADRERFSGYEHKEAREQIKERMKSITSELKRDPQLEAILQRRSKELGIERGSRLDRVLKEPKIERALEISVRGRSQDHDLSL